MLNGQVEGGRAFILHTHTDGDEVRASVLEPGRFGLLFDRHFPAIHRYLHRRVGPELALDLASETFTVAFARRETFNPAQGDVRQWLFGIAANLLRNHRRAERRQLLAYARSGIDPIMEHAFDEAEERIDAQAVGPAIARALWALTEGERDALLLHAWAGLAYEEIARALDVPLGTVRSRLSRGRRKIRELLGADEQVQDVIVKPGGETDG
jgi:RNA polymerase sigma-70 factor (ECF subfamily)